MDLSSELDNFDERVKKAEEAARKGASESRAKLKQRIDTAQDQLEKTEQNARGTRRQDKSYGSQ